jgi:hypothetical protein
VTNPDRKYDKVPRDTFLAEEDGAQVRCACGGNVFRPLLCSPGAYACNSCEGVVEDESIGRLFEKAYTAHREDGWEEWTGPNNFRMSFSICDSPEDISYFRDLKDCLERLNHQHDRIVVLENAVRLAEASTKESERMVRAEIEGNHALREKFRARDNETMEEWIARVHLERDEALRGGGAVAGFWGRATASAVDERNAASKEAAALRKVLEGIIAAIPRSHLVQEAIDVMAKTRQVTKAT